MGTNLDHPIPRAWVAWLVLAVWPGLVSCAEDDAPGPEPALLPCDGGDAFAGVDFSGLWHFQTRFDDFNTGTNVLYIQEVGGAYQASVYGQPALEVALDQRGMYILVRTVQGEAMRVRTREYAICERDADGTVRGQYESCVDQDCYPAEITGHRLDPLDEPASAGVIELGAYNGEADAWVARGITLNVRVDSDLAFVARSHDGLRIVDISDPAAPVERAHVPTSASGEYYNDVKLARGPGGELYALMASNARGVVVIDATEPAAPSEVTTFPGPEEAPGGLPSVHTLFVDQARAYVSYNYDDSLRIYDISDPTQPLALGSYANPRLGQEGGLLHDLYVGQGRAYLNYWNLGMSIVDVADPENPVLLGEYRDYGGRTSHSNWVTQVGGRTVSVHGDEEYGAHVRIVDVDPQSPDFLDTLGSYQKRLGVSVHNILAHEDRAYVTYYQDGLRVLDIQDPENPVEIAHYQTWPSPVSGTGASFFEGAIGVDLEPLSRTVYIADSHRGLIIVQVP